MKIPLTRFTALLFLITHVTGCTDHKISKETLQQDFAFGKFYGECGGEQCVDFFVVRDGALFEDTSDQYPDQQQKYTFTNLVELEQQKYELIKDIPDEIPVALFNEEQTVIGCPDCADGGGLYIEVTRDGKHYYWYIDALSAEPALQEFVGKLKESIRLLD